MPKLLRVVAVPLGNVADLSPRSRAALEEADLLFCEDTRKTRDLAERAALKLKAKLIALPGDRETETDFMRFAGSGEVWAFCSDAGTPIVNDPGRALLLWARDQGVPVEAVPGPSAPVLAWQWSGGFGVPYVFAGFAPKLKSATSVDFEAFFAPAHACATFCFFETKHHIVSTLEALADSPFRESRIFLAREMTKSHEELIGGRVDEILGQVRERLEKDDRFGEITVVLEGRRQSHAGARPSFEELASLKRASPKESARLIAKWTGLSVKEAYDGLVRMQNGTEKEDK